MSIILKALKKVQNQRAEENQPLPDDETAGREDLESDATLAMDSSPEVDAGAAHVRHTRGQSADDQIKRPAFPHARPGGISYRFGLGPKALLGLLLILGIFTTGWFTSRIYISLKSDSATAQVEPPLAAQTPVEDKRQVAQAPLSPAPSVAESTQAEAPKPPIEPARPIATAEIAPSTEPVVVAETTTRTRAVPSPEAAETPVAADQEVVENLLHQVKVAAPNPPIAASSPDRRTVAPPPGSMPAEKESEPMRKGRPELKINAIAWRAREPKAVVNMQSVQVGDVIEGAEVLSIEKKVIRFEYEGETFDVRF